MLRITWKSSGTGMLAAGLFLLASMLAPPNRAQVAAGSTTRISTVPEPVVYWVDGQENRSASAYNWPSGTSHTLYAKPFEDEIRSGIRYTFSSWQVGDKVLAEGNPVTITADPSIPSIRAVYAVEYALTISILNCEEPPCQSPGRVFVGGEAYSYTTTIYAGPGSTVVLQASPNPGYIFAGWSNNNRGQVVQGFINSITLNEPMSVVPIFQPAREIRLSTVPENLRVMADRVTVSTPQSLVWGRGSTHVLAPVTPQQDDGGFWWVFSSWSDGGAATHAYTVDATLAPGGIVATYSPAMRVTLATVPTGLKLKIDGREGSPPYNPIWGVRETHQVEAPLRQTDAQGRTWVFDAWSDAAAAARSVTVPETGVEFGVRFVASYKQLGRVTVTTNLGGIAAVVDGVECKMPCSVERPLGAQVKVSAPAIIPLGESSRAEFDKWSDGTTGTAVVTAATEPQSLQASYRTMNRLVVSADPSNGALCRTSPGSTDGFYASGTVVAVAAEPRAGFRFRRWEGDLSGSTPSANVMMSEPRSARAVFERIPYIAPSGVRNAAGEGIDGVAPGGIVSVFGAHLAGEEMTGPESPLAQTLGDVTVRVGERLLPLFFVSPERITAQLPPEQAEGPASVATRWGNQNEVRAEFQVVRNAPGLFAAMEEDRAWAVASHADGSPVNIGSPARAGERITIFGTGFGPTTPVRPWGFAVPAEIEYRLLDPVNVQLEGNAVAAESASAAAGRIGVDAVVFRVPPDLPPGKAVALSAESGGRPSNIVFLPIE